MVPAFVVVAVLLAPMAAAPLAADAPAPGCAPETPRVTVCSWSIELDPTRMVGSREFVLPGLTIVEVRVQQSTAAPGPLPGLPQYEWWITDAEGVYLAGGEHRSPGALVDATGKATFYLRQGSVETLGPGGTLVPSRNEVRLVLTQIVHERPAPARAGGPEDPQSLDRVGDQTGPAFTDVAGAWLHQPNLANGLIEVGLVVPALAEYHPCQGQPGGQCDTTDPARRTAVESNSYSLKWMLLGEESEVDWNALDDGAKWVAHLHFRFVHDAGAATDGQRAGPQVTVLAKADPENGTLRALVPLRFLGDPPAQAPFTNITGISSYFASGQRQPPYDEASTQVRPFATGGPEVWAALRGETYAPAPEPAWYRDPFAPDNLLDTAQAAGLALAVITGTTGAIVVHRRRERLDRLLREIDLAAEGQDALGLLERLEREYDAMLVAAKLDEKTHDVLIRRIERHGFRLLRRGPQ